MGPSFERLDRFISSRMERYGHRLLRLSLAAIFIWFGALKLAGSSAANELVERTIYWLPPSTFIPILGAWEVAIGLGLLARKLLRTTIALLFAQMAGTFLPLLLLPEVCFIDFPWVPTLEGQYIIKNLILISAAIVIGGTVRHAPGPRLE